MKSNNRNANSVPRVLSMRAGTPMVQKIIIMALFILIALDITMALFRGMALSLELPIVHLDGAFQAASGLYRLADGQLPGRDFFSYIGAGLLYYLYPLFFLGGEQIFASELSARTMTHLAGGLTIGFIVFLVFFQHNPPWRAVILGFIAGSLMMVLIERPETNGIWIFDLYAGPGSSLRPLRAFAPYLAGAMIFILGGAEKKRPLSIIATGIFVGFLFLWSPDFGPISALAVTLYFVLRTQGSPLSRGKQCGLMIGASVLTLYGLTGGQPLALISYHLFDVGHDQYWYFVPWHESVKLFSLSDGIPKLTQDITVRGLVLPAFAIYTRFRSTRANHALLVIGVALVTGGAIPEIGGHRDPSPLGYFSPFRTWCVVVGLAIPLKALWHLSQFVIRKRDAAGSRVRIANTVILPIVLFASTLVSGISAYSSYMFYLERSASLVKNTGYIFVAELGGYLPSRYRDYLDFVRQNKDRRIMEEYWGIASAMTRQHSPSRSDSVIHALGRERATFASIPEQWPDFIVTTNRQQHLFWHSFSLVMNWGFYRSLFKNFEPIPSADFETISWKRTPPRSWTQSRCYIVNADKPYFVVEAEAEGFYDVLLQYRVLPRAKHRSLFMTQTNINWPGKGFASIDPSGKKVSLPILAKQTGENVFFIRTIPEQPLMDAIHLESCQAFVVPTNLPSTVVPSMSLSTTSLNLNYDKWVAGLATGKPHLLIEDNSANRSAFTAGKKILFADDSTREILAVQSNEPGLEIQFDGAPLDGNLVGYPKPIKLLPQ